MTLIAHLKDALAIMFGKLSKGEGHIPNASLND